MRLCFSLASFFVVAQPRNGVGDGRLFVDPRNPFRNHHGKLGGNQIPIFDFRGR